MNYFNTIVKNMANPNSQEEMKAEIKKRDNFINKLQDKLKTVMQEKQFVNKSYQELEKKFEILSNQTSSEQVLFKKNVEMFSANLQKIPQQIIELVISSLLQKFGETLGQEYDASEVKSVLELDFNYKAVFADYISKIFELTKQSIRDTESSKNQVSGLQAKLNLKDKEIEEIVERYEAHVEQLKKEVDSKLATKTEEYNIVKEQKDNMIRDLSNSLKLKVQQNEDLKAAINKCKTSENQMRVQKQKTQQKLFEQCQISKDIQNKKDELDRELKEIKEENEKVLNQAIQQKNGLLIEMAYLKQQCKRWETEVAEQKDANLKLKESYRLKRQSVLQKLERCHANDVKNNLLNIKEEILKFNQKKKEQNIESRLEQAIQNYYSLNRKKDTQISLLNEDNGQLKQHHTKNQTASVIQSQTRVQLDQKIRLLQQKNREVTALLLQKDNQIKRYEEAIAQLRIQLSVQMQKIKKLQQKCVQKDNIASRSTQQLKQAKESTVQISVLLQKLKEEVKLKDEFALQQQKVIEQCQAKVMEVEILSSQKLDLKQSQYSRMVQEFNRSKMGLEQAEKRYQNAAIALAEEVQKNNQLAQKTTEMAAQLGCLQNQLSQLNNLGQNSKKQKEQISNELVQTKNLINSLQKQKLRLSQENNVLKGELQSKAINLQKQKSQIERLIHQQTEQLKQYQTVNQKLLDRELSLNEAKKEFQQLSKTLEQKQIQIKQLKIKLSQQQTENVQKNSIQKDKNETEKNKLVLESDQLKKEIVRKENQIEELKLSISMMDEKINILNESLNNKQGESGNSVQMIADLQQRYKGEIHQKSEKIVSLQTTIRQLSHDFDELNETIKHQQEAICRQKSQKIQKDNLINQNQCKIGDLNSELQLQRKDFGQLKVANEKLQEEINDWKTKYQQLDTLFQKYLRELQELRKHNIQYIQRQGRMTEELSISVKKCEQKSSEIVFFQSKITQLQQERTHLKSIEEQLERTLFQTSDEFRSLQIKMHRQNDLFNKERDQFIKKQKDFIEVINANQTKLMSQAKQIEEDRQRIVSLDTEIVQLKLSIQKLKQQFSNTQNQQVELIRKQLEQTNNRLKELNQCYTLAKQNNQILSSQNTTMSEQITKTNKQYDEITKYIEQSEKDKQQMSNTLKQCTVTLQQMQKQNSAGKELLNKKISEWQDEKKQFTRIIEENMIKIQVLNLSVGEKQREITAMKEQIKSKVQENQTLIKTKYLLTKQLDEIKQQGKQNNSQNRKLEKTVIHINQKNQQLQKIIAQLNNQIKQKTQSIQQISESLVIKQNNINKLQQQIQQAKIQLNEKTLNYEKQKSQITSHFKREIEAKDCRVSDQMQKVETLETAKRQIQAMKDALSQRIIILENEMDQKADAILQKQKQIFKWQDNYKSVSQQLKHQIELKNQALQDQQLMSQFYKDFQTRQSQLTAKNQAIKQLQVLQSDFTNIFFKDFNKESLLFIKSSIDRLNEQIRFLKQSNESVVKQKNGEIEKLKQDILQNAKISQHFQSRFLEEQNLKIKVESQLKQKALQIQTLGKDYKSKEIDLLNSMNKLESGMEKLKMEIQQYKNKLSKKQSEVSKYMESISALESKAAFLKTALSEKQGEVNGKQTAINNLRKEVQTTKQKLNAQIKSKIFEKELLQKQNQRIRSQIQKVNIESALQIKKQLLTKEEQFKSQKQNIDSKHNQQAKRIREQVESVRKQKQEIQRELNSAKIIVLEQKKVTARLQAELQEARSDINKFDNLKSSNVQIQQKMSLKDEQIKKCFANINSLKVTISELQEGIQTYQSMAEEKQKQVQVVNETILQFREENDRLKNDIERLQRKLRDSRVQTRAEHMMAQRQISPVLSRKQESILALKLLFLKYFQPTSTYQTKLRTFDTLCEVLSLNSKENQLMNQYKRTRLSKQAMNDHKQKGKGSFQNKFLDFLSSDQ